MSMWRIVTASTGLSIAIIGILLLLTWLVVGGSGDDWMVDLGAFYSALGVVAPGIATPRTDAPC